MTVRTKKLPDDATKHKVGDVNAVTIPAEGFEKLIVFGSWVHQDYRIKPKKSKKKGKKGG